MAICIACFCPVVLAQLHKQPVQIHGHRGGRALFPENTPEAFIAAWEAGADWLELDLVVSQDSHLVVSHEPWFNPDICDCGGRKAKGNFYRMTLEQIQAVQCGGKGHPDFKTQQPIAGVKPTLAQLMRAMADAGLAAPVYWNIEVKSKPAWYGTYQPYPDAYARLVLRELTILGLLDRCFVQSFDPGFLQALHTIKPDLPLALLTFSLRSPRAQLRKLNFQPYSLNPYYRFAGRRFVWQTHNQGVRTMCWTVNNRRSFIKALRSGFDGVITDYPQLLAQLLKRPQRLRNRI
jgi:glycerophosphoryl diester phosphodiesterase